MPPNKNQNSGNNVLPVPAVNAGKEYGPLVEIGSSGLDRTGGFIVEEEFVRELQGRQAAKIYKQMRDNDPVVGTICFVIDMLMRQVSWTVEPFDDSPGAAEDADFLETCMNDMSMTWADMISEIFSMVEFGWAWSEIVYKRRNGENSDDPTRNSKYNDSRIGWRKIALRAQETLYSWKFDEDGGVQAMIQNAPPVYEIVEVPIERSLLFRTQVKKQNPEGRSLLRTAYRPWYYKRRVEEIEGVGIERDLAGLPFARVDPEILSANATPEQKQMLNNIKQIVTNVRQDSQAGVIWPNIMDENGNSLYTFELLSSGGARQFDTNAIIERYSRQIAMTVLADFILLGHESVGSFALSSDKTDLFAVALGTLKDSVAAVFNKHGVPRLWRLNGLDTSKMPKIVAGDIEMPDLAELASYVSSLAAAGAPLFPDKKLAQHLRKIAGLPEADEELLDHAASVGFAPPPGTDGGAAGGEAPPPPSEPVQPAPVQKDRWKSGTPMGGKFMPKGGLTIMGIHLEPGDSEEEEVGKAVPDGVQAAAKRALQWHKDGYSGSGFTKTGLARANQLASGEEPSDEVKARMRSFFARHGVHHDSKHTLVDGKPTPWRVAWDAWGGDAGRAWVGGAPSDGS